MGGAFGFPKIGVCQSAKRLVGAGMTPDIGIAGLALVYHFTGKIRTVRVDVRTRDLVR